MKTSRWPAVRDALVAAATATGVETWDGKKNSFLPAEVIIVGADETGADDLNHIRQAYVGAGGQSKDENGEIVVTIIVQTGDSDVTKANRDRVFTISGQLETTFRSDPSLAGVVGSPGWVHMDEATPTERQNADGSYCRLLVIVSYQARI